MRKHVKDVLVVGAISLEEKEAIGKLLGSLMIEFAHKLSLARRLMKKIHFHAVILWASAKHFIRDLVDRKFSGKIIFATNDKKDKKKSEGSKNGSPIHSRVVGEILRGVGELFPAT